MNTQISALTLAAMLLPAITASAGPQESAEGALSGPRSPAAEKRNANYVPWNPKDMEKLRKQVGLVGPGPQSQIPKPSFPGYLKTPKSINEVMPQARAAIRQTGGRVPLGLAEPGDVVVIAVPYDADPMVQEAIVAAFKERDIEARVLYETELVGVSKADMEAIEKAKSVFKAGDGQQEAGPRFAKTHGVWPNRKMYKDWVEEQDPVFYGATWPKINYPSERLAEIDENYRQLVSKALIHYLDENPKVNRVYYRSGGRPKARAALKQHSKKFMGNYTYYNRYDIMSQVPNFPADVWRMLESKTIESLPFIDRAEATDPEGTALWWEVTPQEAQAWFDGSYEQGHLYLFPNQATGKYPYSLVDYPALSAKYIQPIQVEANGVIASTNSHATNHNRIEVHVKDGYVQDIRGGGMYGDGFRLAMKYPKINEMTWPLMKKPGFWWLFEAGTGTNPKYFKHPGELLQGANSSERNAGGVIHWSFGAEIKSGPDEQSKAWAAETIKFGKDNKLPVGHGMHHHNLLPTHQVRLRDTGKWVTLLDNGTLQAYNDPEVRALAARYGNPDALLKRDWIPEIPGITAEGNYNRDYASKAGQYWTNWSNSINHGTNKYIK